MGGTKYNFRRRNKSSIVEKKKSSKRKRSKRFLLINTILLSLLLIGCFIGGIVLGLMTSSFTPDINVIPNEKNVFKFLLKDNKVIIGGNLNIDLHISSKTILSYKVSVKKVQYFYYPIGKSYSCLLYNGGLENLKSPISLSKRSKLGIPLNNEESFFKTKFDFQVQYAFRKESEAAISVPLYLGYEVTDSLKEEVQPLYNDCKNFQRMYFSVQFSNINIMNHFKYMKKNKVFDLVFYCTCSIDENLDTFFNGTSKYKKTILSELKNNPSLIT